MPAVVALDLAIRIGRPWWRLREGDVLSSPGRFELTHELTAAVDVEGPILYLGREPISIACLRAVKADA